MGKQHHDLGHRKRMMQEPERRAAAARRRAAKTEKSASIGDPRPLPANYYGPPEHIRLAAYEYRKAGFPDMAQRIMDGREVVTLPTTDHPRPGDRPKRRSEPSRTNRSRHRAEKWAEGR